MNTTVPADVRSVPAVAPGPTVEARDQHEPGEQPECAFHAWDDRSYRSRDPNERAALEGGHARADFPPLPCHDDRRRWQSRSSAATRSWGRSTASSAGRLRSPAAFVLEGEAGIGKSTLWLAGVEAARERGLRVLSSRPAEVELGVAHAGLGDLLEDVLAGVLHELPAPRRRALEIALLIRDDADEPVDFRTLAVAVRTALQLLAEREPVLVAIDDVQWLDPSSASALAFALRRLAEEDIRILLARRLGDGIRGLRAGACARRDPDDVDCASGPSVQALCMESCSGSSAEASRGRRSFVFTKPLAGTRSSRSRWPARSAPTGETATRPGPSACPRRSRSSSTRGSPSFRSRAGRRSCIVAAAGGPTRALLRAAEVDDHALEPAFAAGVIAPAGDGVVFTHPLLASVLYQRSHGSERRSAHRVLAALVEDSVARAHHLGLSADGPDPEIAATLEHAAAVAFDRGAPIVAADLGEQAVRLTSDAAHEDHRRRSLAAARAHVAAGEEERPRAIALELLEQGSLRAGSR